MSQQSAEEANIDSETESGQSVEEKLAQRKNPDLGALQRAHEDAQRTLDGTLEVFSESAGKAGKIVRFNGVVLALLLTVGTNIENIGKYLNYNQLESWPLLVGIFVVTGATVAALHGHRVESVKNGVSTDRLKYVRENSLTESEYLQWVLADGYEEWIDTANNQAHNRATYVQYVLISSMIGFALVFIGIIIVAHL